MPRRFPGGAGSGTCSPTASVIIPPGGFAGFAQQTPATQALFGGTGGNRSGTRRRKRKKKANTARRGPAARRKGGTRAKRNGRRLVKGSAEARAHMARLRKKRRKK